MNGDIGECSQIKYKYHTTLPYHPHQADYHSLNGYLDWPSFLGLVLISLLVRPAAVAGDQLPKPPASTAPPRCVRVMGTCRASRHLGPPRDGIPAGITGRPAPYRDRGSGGDVCGRKPGGNGRPVHILSVVNIMPEPGRSLSHSILRNLNWYTPPMTLTA